MGNLKIDANKVAEAKASAKIVGESLDATHKKCKAVISYVEGASWSGKSRDAFLTFMEIIEQYHADVKKNYKKQKKALNALDDYVKDFEDTSYAKDVKNL
ncbi:WXG100 family type VII secretion target [Listeria seeligeri]|uniref:WXG100 family type VII secretion target n=1 Tax=Listeria seeligeri TaxID=1640 RepID=A0A7X0X456_LISSE|nr:WXG100 family type VII secretion target [Listeria seeligeri]MBC1487313.1 WXG100 family type VII secretion target [Listeria seeligeri]